jgi:aminoglycoside phosphotransferase (APT) family kinase protein
VVKFSPKDKQDDPWYDVHKEYYFLEDANIQKKLPVPEPLHRSSEEERRVVGTKFIIMSFVEGKSYENASSVPRAHREKAFSSVMKEMANIHGMWWYTRSWPWLFWKSLHVHTRSDHFWDSQVRLSMHGYHVHALYRQIIR